MPRSVLLLLVVTFTTYVANGQVLDRAEEKFHTASAQYIEKQYDQALATVKEGLRIKPNSEKLEALRKLLEQEKKNQQQQQNQEQQKQDKDKQDQKQDQKDQQQKDQQDNSDEKKQDGNNKNDEENQKKSDQEQKENEPSKPEDEKEQKNDEKPAPSQRLEDLKMSEEKARMILEAMKNQELQYLQQKKRKATQPRDRTKPDW
jgi:Ca-activated chloride channel family protein